ncbi:polysaccharide pyruvyl transferase family protein [Coleofasciculus sp.]|uniref:polysaccharide pyruvyl transferase family protein n=1 Tax=Coleofasciculus sp. TaxID=3100458 RepID=UPI0039F85FC3
MKNKSPKIWLMGASLETPNMGVNALSEASLKCIFTQWHDAEVILRTVVDESDQKITIGGRDIWIKNRALWTGINLSKPNNVYVLIIYALLLKLLPFKGFQQFLERTNLYFKELMEADLVADITYGDSFSDLYGMSRFRSDAFLKILVILCQKKLILLPQTYGPFKSPVAKALVKYILKQATLIYSRDKNGVEYTKELLGSAAENKSIIYIPDVAFVLEPDKPDVPIIKQLEKLKEQGKVIIGLNISGILYNGGQKADQQFGLKGNYRELPGKIIKYFMEQKDTIVILVSHVYGEDNQACQTVYDQISGDYPERVLLVEDKLNHKQVKYLIGCCDFFLGSRMHSCIAAISQCVPAIGLAYSGKFIGVFESAGVGNYVVDLRTEDEQKILSQVEKKFGNRQEAAATLRATIPQIQKQVIQLFEGVDKTLNKSNS